MPKIFFKFFFSQICMGQSLYKTIKIHAKNHFLARSAWATQIWLKNNFQHEFLLFYVQLLCAINFCFGPVEMWLFKNNCCGLKIDWGSPPGCSYLRNAYYIIIFCCFTQVFVDSAYKQLTMALSQARNLLRRNYLSGNLTDDCVNNFMSFFE